MTSARVGYFLGRGTPTHAGEFPDKKITCVHALPCTGEIQYINHTAVL